MTMTTKGSEFYFWRSNDEWYTYVQGEGFSLTDKAPDEARLNFQAWKDRNKQAMKNRK